MSKQLLFFFLIILLFFNFFLWQEIFSLNKNEICFLSVGQGDSEMISFSKKTVFLIDAGPRNGQILWQLSKKLPFFKRRIDLAILSHPDIDHYGGFLDIAKKYEIGAFLYNGQEPKSQFLKEIFEKMLENFSQKGTKIVKLSLGDKIFYQNSSCQVIWPVIPFLSKRTNENSLVLFCSLAGKKVLFTGDIGKFAEKRIYSLYQDDLQVDILKVPHHGSKSSLEENFFLSLKPKISIIEVGKGNPYNFPSTLVTNFLAKISNQIIRTDKQGTYCLSF